MEHAHPRTFLDYQLVTVSFRRNIKYKMIEPLFLYYKSNHSIGVP